MNIFDVTYQSEEELAMWGMCPPMPQAVRLLDGTIVTVRSIQPDDALRLQGFFARLSPTSIYLRFLHYRKGLSYQEAVCLTTVDHRTQMALVATREGKAGEDIIAVARYAMPWPSEPYWAEPAIVVEDQYQGRGLGMLLFKWQIGHAWSHGIRIFRAMVHPYNMRMLRFIEYSRLPAKRRLELGAWDITIRLEPNNQLTGTSPSVSHEQCSVQPSSSLPLTSTSRVRSCMG